VLTVPKHPELKTKLKKAGLPLLDEYKNHTSLRNLFVEGFHVITI